MIDRGITVIDSEPEIDSIFKSIKKGEVKFENCKYITWKEVKEWALIRVSNSYKDIMENLMDGWKSDTAYMKLANQKFIRLIQKKTLELGISKPDSRIWDIVSYIIFLVYNLYAWHARREYAPFVFSI